MKHAPLVTGLVAALLATACQTATKIDVPEARRAHKVEITFDGDGGMSEVEYHILPSQVPEAVRAAMDKLHPGGDFTDAEREVNDGELYYELSRTVDGLEVEAMFTEKGVLHSEEVEVRAESVPAEVRNTIASTFSDGVVDKYEEIRDGSRALVEYHVKIDHDGRRHKLILSKSGKLMGDYLELLAEVEVPAGG